MSRKVSIGSFKHLNINSIRNKFDALPVIMKTNVDILMTSETKLDDAFPAAYFLLHGFSAPYRLGRNSNSGRIMLYINPFYSSVTFLYSLKTSENLCFHISISPENVSKPLVSYFNTPCKRQKTFGFLTFSGGIEI